jgi:hypothetical protein
MIMSKRSIIVALVGVNLLLLGGLLLTAYQLPEAKAQGVGRGGNYLMCAGQIEAGLDALYVLNLDQQAINVVLMNRQGNRPEIVGVQKGPDLVSDLRKETPRQERERPARRR